MWLPIYYTFISLASILFMPLWLLSARQRGRPGWPWLRMGFKSQALARLPKGGVWVHALSVGEVNSAIPLVRELSKQYPNVYLTTSTYTGLQLAKHQLGKTCQVLVRPLDVPWVVHNWLRRLKPAQFILVESDMWPGWQRSLKKAGVLCSLVNARISPRSLASYKKCLPLARLLYKDFDQIYVQSQLDQERLGTIGIAPSYALGNLKFDSLPAPLDNSRQQALAAELGLPKHAKVLVAGSTHAGEEEVCTAAWRSLKAEQDLYLVIAPRDIKRAAQILASIADGEGWLFSQGPLPEGKHILLLDVMGWLAQVYALATVAFVGGSLVSEGGHNPLEAAIQGVPVLFGPHMEDFAQMARSLTDAYGAKQLKNKDELARAVKELLDSPAMAAKMGAVGQQFCLQHQGACQRIIKALPLTRGNHELA